MPIIVDRDQIRRDILMALALAQDGESFFAALQ